MTYLMKGMFDLSLSGSHSSVTGRSIIHLIHRPVAGKSGTTNTDSWMIGFTPQLLTGVWVGFMIKSKRYKQVKDSMQSNLGAIYRRCLTRTIKATFSKT
ncbi:hypothetical protein KHA80_11025 [Anaerobacillus sp. HL2]|nr:hypothetical protein KHA80_11025 [Anaerobacillus sp. HL2]